MVAHFIYFCTKHYVMKKIYLFLLWGLFASNAICAQSINQSTELIRANDFQISRPLTEIFKDGPFERIIDKERIKESKDRENRKPIKYKYTARDGEKYGNDINNIQTKMGEREGATTRVNVAGQTASGFRPFDPSGSVGPNHYIQMINSTTFRIYNKSTMAIMLTGTLGNLWSPATGNNGDPIVMYDKAADRWFLAQFGNSTDKRIYIAVSTTPDPLGTYYTYTYTSAQFPDYLKFSVWPDAYYMTSNQPQQKVFAFNRAEILAGTPSARSVVVNYNPPVPAGFFCPLPADAADGTLPPTGTPCPIFSYSDNGWGSGYNDAVNIYDMNVNWTPTVPTATVTLNSSIPCAAFDASYQPSWNDISQPGTTQKLDGIGGAMMYRAQWKSWSGYNSLVLNWGVLLSPTQRSIKWCELRQNQTSGVWSMYQEGIYAPDAASRWMGSIAMDKNGSIGLSYLKSDATSIYPGLYYTGRNVTDPLGTMPFAEQTVVLGTGSQTSGNRVGDYAHMVLDMDGETFWSTSEYMGGSTGSSAASTRIFSFQLAAAANTAGVSITQTGGPCTGALLTFTATPINGGTAPIYQWKRNNVNVGTNSNTYTSSSLVSGDIISCVMTSNAIGIIGSPASSNGITVSITLVSTPSVTIAQTIGTNPFCLGYSNGFTATPVNGGNSPSYQWKVNGNNVGTNAPTFVTTTLANNDIVTCILTSDKPCVTAAIATSNAIVMNVISGFSPTVSISQIGGTNPFCLGSSLTFIANVGGGSLPIYQWKVNGVNAGTNSPSFSSTSLTNNQIVSCVATVQPPCPPLAIIGNIASTTYNATNSGVGACYPTYFGNGRQQYLIRASELTALGLGAGSLLNSIAFTIANTIGSPITLNGYTIKIGTTSSTTMNSTFKTGTFTTVFGPTNYTPILNTSNQHQFIAPYTWNGTSNLVIDICFSNQVNGTIAYRCLQTGTSFVSSTYYQSDGASGANACANATGSSASMRPNMTFTIGSSSTTNATSNSITVNTLPQVPASVSIMQTTGTNPSCPDGIVGFTATAVNGGATPNYQWKLDGISIGTNSNVLQISNLVNGQVITCEMTTSNACATPNLSISNSITINTIAPGIPSVSISQTGGTNPICVGTPSIFTAMVSNLINPIYQWKRNGLNVGANSPTYTANTTLGVDNITCVVTGQTQCPNTYLLGDAASTTYNAVTSDAGAAYPSYYGNGRQQYLIKASELTALGFSAGNISTIGFNINATVGNPATLNGYTIKLAHTAVNNLNNTFETPSFTTVFGPVNYTPVINTLNKHIFNTAFAWNGTSNLLVDICFSNQVVGTVAYQNLQTATSFISNNYYQADGTVGINACGEISGITTSLRPNMTFVLSNQSITLNANTIALTTNSCSSTVQLKLYIQGYYLNNGFMQAVQLNQGISMNSNIVDNVTIELRNPSNTLNPLGVVASQTAMLNTNGTVSAVFSNLPTGNYYLVIKHKNTIPTWSSNPMLFNGGIVVYDFSAQQSMAYGSNQVLLDTNIWGFYSGDISQDGNVDNQDFSMWEFDSNQFNAGYLATDLNGDGTVENFDFALWEYASNLFTSEVTP